MRPPLRRRRGGDPDVVEAARTHPLALEAATWKEIERGARTFDIRLDDGRGYSVDDVVALWEIEPERGVTRRVCVRRISHIAPVFQHSKGLVVVLALLPVDDATAAAARREGPPELADDE